MTPSRSSDASAVLAGLLSLTVLVSAGPAFGEDRAEARRLFARAERAFAESDWDLALEQYTSAYEAAPLPGFLFNIAQCHRKLEHWEEAADFFGRYLEALPQAPNRADAQDLLEEVRGHLAPPAPAAPPPRAAPPPPVPPVRTEPPPPEGGLSLRPLTWISLGASVALAAVAVAFALDLSAAQSAFDEPSLDCARRPERCRDLRDRGETAATARTLFAVTAVAALAAGGVFLVLDLRAPADDREPQVALSLGLTRVSAEVTW